MIRVAVALLLFSVTVAACFNKEEQSGAYTCTDDSTCPKDFRCVQGICYDRSADLAGLSGDGGSMSVASGCANPSRGHKLSDKAWACAGPFGQGEVLSLCAPRWWTCPSLDAAELAECKRTSGFFVSQNWFWSRTFDRCNSINQSNTSCTQTDSSFVYKYRLGCGLDEKKNAQACDYKCQEFDQGVSCMRFKPPGYSCGMNQLPLEDTSTVPEIGTLCCPL